MEICVAIPSYNRAEYLQEAIDSVLEQTLPPAQIFVCDDGSTDNTQAILQSYGDKLRWAVIENSGPALARKFAIENTSAPWVALLDSDDRWRPDHLERLVGAIKTWPETDMVFSNYVKIDELGQFSDSNFMIAMEQLWRTLIEQSEGSYQNFGKMAYPGVLNFPNLLTTCQIFRRNLYNQVGGIDRAMARMVSEDAHLSLRMAAYGNVVCDLKVSADIRRHSGNYSRDKLRVLIGDMEVRKHILKNKMIPDHFMKLTANDIAKLKIEVFNNYFWNRDFQAARAVAPESLVHTRDPRIFMRALIVYAAKIIGK